MAAKGLIERTIVNSSGTAQASQSVLVMKRAALATSGSGTSPVTITVNHPGGIVAGDTLEIYNKDQTTQVSSSGATSQFTCDSITDTTVVASGFSGTLTITDDDIIIPLSSSGNPIVYEDEQGNETKAAANAALTTGSDGRAFGYVQGGVYSLKLSGSAITTQVVANVAVFAEDSRSDETNVATAVAWALDTLRSISTSGGKLVSVRTGGSEKYFVDYQGGFTAAQASTITAGGLTITAGGLTITAGGATITAGGLDINGGGATVAGGLTVDDTGITVTAGGQTITAGGLTITAGGATITAGGLTVAAGGIDFQGAFQSASAVKNADASLILDLDAGQYNVHITDNSNNIGTIQIDSAVPTVADDGREVWIYNRAGGAQVLVDNSAASNAALYMKANTNQSLTDGDMVLLKYTWDAASGIGRWLQASDILAIRAM